MEPKPSWMPSIIALGLAWVLAEIIYQTGGGLWAKHVAFVGTVALALVILTTELLIAWRNRPSRFHQDWWDNDGNLLKCSSPKHHERFNQEPKT